MESAEEYGGDLLVFAGSAERDVLCSRIFWKSLRLQPPLESRLVSGSMEQRLRPAGGNAPKKNFTQLQQLEDLKTEYFVLEAQRKTEIEQRTKYLQKAKKREEIIMLLKKQREDRIKKELISHGHKPEYEAEKPRLTTPDTEILDDLEAVKKLN